MKNKKALSETTVVVLIMGLLSLVVLVGVGYTITQGISSAGNKAAIQNWVLLKSSKLGAVQGSSQPPVAMLYSEPIKINTEEQLKKDANKIVADAMVDCWSAFDNGKSNFIEKGKDVSDPFCFPCAKLEFDQSLKDGVHNLVELDKFLSNEKPIISEKAQTYHEILEGKYVYEQTIQKDKNFYIFFIATKGKIWDRLVKRLMAPDIYSEISKRAAAGAFIGGAAGSVLPGPGTAVGVVIGIGAGVLEYYASPVLGIGEEYFEPMVILGTPEKISEYCNLKLDKCEDCGKGTTNPCDKDECQGIADEIGTSCWYDDGYIYNNCFSQQKQDTEELKSANPLTAQEPQQTSQITGPFTGGDCNAKESPLNIKSKPCISAETIKIILTQANSPAIAEDQNFANSLYNFGVQYGIDPAIALAFFKKESTYGKFGYAKETRSTGNILYTSNCAFKYSGKTYSYCGYNTWSEGAEAWYKLISGKGYIGVGKNTVEEIVPKYCPPSACNTKLYIIQIKSSVEEYRNMQNQQNQPEPLLTAQK